MGYRKIAPLQSLGSHPIGLFKECYALEKIHGTSTHIAFTRQASVLHDAPWSYGCFSGGIKHADFLAMLLTKYRLEDVVKRLQELTNGHNVNDIVVYGEGYGGKCQKMSHVYGPTNFVAFEVKRDDFWLSPDRAKGFVESIGLPFVHYEVGPVTIEWLESQKNRPSEQARINGLWDGNHETGDKFPREGIVVRPLMELVDQHGGRIMAKYRKPENRETKRPRDLTGDSAKVQQEAEAVAEEYCVAMRLEHVMSKLIANGVGEETPGGWKALSIKHTGDVCRAFAEDVAVEASRDDGIEWTPEMGKAVSRKACQMFKDRLRGNMGFVNPIEGQ